MDELLGPLSRTHLFLESRAKACPLKLQVGAKVHKTHSGEVRNFTCSRITITPLTNRICRAPTLHGKVSIPSASMIVPLAKHAQDVLHILCHLQVLENRILAAFHDDKSSCISRINNPISAPCFVRIVCYQICMNWVFGGIYE